MDRVTLSILVVTFFLSADLLMNSGSTEVEKKDVSCEKRNWTIEGSIDKHIQWVMFSVCMNTRSHTTKRKIQHRDRNWVLSNVELLFIYFQSTLAVKVIQLTFKLWPERKLLFLLAGMWMTDFPYQRCFSVTRKQDLFKELLQVVVSR